MRFIEDDKLPIDVVRKELLRIAPRALLPELRLGI